MRLVVQCLQAASPAEWETLEEMEIYNITIEYLESAAYASVYSWIAAGHPACCHSNGFLITHLIKKLFKWKWSGIEGSGSGSEN